jgi:hypothetical protein
LSSGGDMRIATAGARRFNRSSLIMSSASMVPVEKSGPDFHRLAAPTRPKSPIRSIPKYGSANVGLDYDGSRTFGGIELLDLYLDGGPTRSTGGFRAGSVANHLRRGKACRALMRLYRRYRVWPDRGRVHYRGPASLRACRARTFN